jgi:DNA-binding Lrp family transcriptional regulator
MVDLRTDEMDKKLINLLQVDFPLVAEPFSVLGERLSISEDDVISRIQVLKAKGIVRLIGPVMEARKLGFQTTLVAMSVPSEKMKKTEIIIAAHPAVSHAYEREHRLNLWVTFAAPAQTDIENEINQLAIAVESSESFSLPALKLFKIGAYFGMGNNGDDSEEALPGQQTGALPGRIALTTEEKLALNVLQQDLPLIHSPFTDMAAGAGLKVEAFLAVCGSLLKRGALRRYSASINHRNAGYKANAMTCWLAPPAAVEKAGNEMAKMRQVSHCYERKTHALWPYNLYSMLHARSRETCNELIGELSRRTGLDKYLVLFSTREFKKTRIKYNL